VRCRNVPAGPVKVPRWIRSSSRRITSQVFPVAFPAMRMNSSASQHSRTRGADPLFEPGVDRPQVKDGFHVPPAALESEELLVSGGEQFHGAHHRGATRTDDPDRRRSWPASPDLSTAPYRRDCVRGSNPKFVTECDDHHLRPAGHGKRRWRVPLLCPADRCCSPARKLPNPEQRPVRSPPEHVPGASPVSGNITTTRHLCRHRCSHAHDST
jgi:hypothetical protein